MDAVSFAVLVLGGLVACAPPGGSASALSAGAGKTESDSWAPAWLEAFSIEDGALVYSRDGQPLLHVEEHGPDEVSIRPAGSTGEVRLSSDGTLIDKLTDEGRGRLEASAIALAEAAKTMAGESWPTSSEELSSMWNAFVKDLGAAITCTLRSTDIKVLVAFALSVVIVASAIGALATAGGVAYATLVASAGFELATYAGGYALIRGLIRTYTCYESTYAAATSEHDGSESRGTECRFDANEAAINTLSATGLRAAPGRQGSLGDPGSAGCYSFSAPRSSDAPPLSPVFELSRPDYSGLRIELCAYAAGPPDVLDHIDGSWFCSDGEFQEAAELTHELATVGCCLSTYAQTPWLQLMDLPREIDQLYASVARPAASEDTPVDGVTATHPAERFTLSVRR